MSAISGDDRRHATWLALAAMAALAACGGSQNGMSSDTTMPDEQAQARDSVEAEPSGGAATSSAEASGGSRFATDDVAYLSRLGLIRGHLRVGIELYRNGHVMHAQSHMKHPGDELYAALADAFAARGAEGFADELDVLATAVESEAPQDEVDAAYEALLAAVDEAETHVADSIGTDAAAQGRIVVNLLETAAEEYGIGVAADGEVTDVHEYQDAYGFTLTAGERARSAESRVVSRSDHAVFQTLVEEIDALSRFWPAVVPEASVDATPAELEEWVARIATEADRL